MTDARTELDYSVLRAAVWTLSRAPELGWRPSLPVSYSASPPPRQRPQTNRVTSHTLVYIIRTTHSRFPVFIVIFGHYSLVVLAREREDGRRESRHRTDGRAPEWNSRRWRVLTRSICGFDSPHGRAQEIRREELQVEGTPRSLFDQRRHDRAREK